MTESVHTKKDVFSTDAPVREGLPSNDESYDQAGRYSTMTSNCYTSRSSSNQMHPPPLKFHLKSNFLSNLLVPSMYLALNIFVSLSLLQIVTHVHDDAKLANIGRLFVPLFLSTILFYLLSAFTNPGLLIGNEQDQLRKAQEKNLRHQREMSAVQN